MANSNDTGTGGIEIDGKVYAMDVGVPDAEGGSQGQWSPGNINVDNSVKDISKPTKETFARYLSKLTLAQEGSSTHKNVYPVGTGASTVVSKTSLTTYNGKPMPLGETLNEKFFKQVNIGEPPPPGIKKGISNDVGYDGNVLLPNATLPGSAGGQYVKNSGGLVSPVKDFTDKVLDKNLYDSKDASNNDKSIAESGEFFGPPKLHSTALLDENSARIAGQDKGTFDEIVNNSAKKIGRAHV